MKKSYFIYIPIVLAILFIVVPMGMRCSLLLFIDIGSFIITIILSILLTLCTFSPSEIVSYFVIVLKKDTTSIIKIKNGVHFFKVLQLYLIFSALVGFIIGMIIALARLDDPRAIGPGIAFSLLTILYSSSFILIIITPFKTGLIKMLNEISQ